MMSLRNHAFLLGRLTVRAARAAIYTIVPQQCPQQNSPTYHSYGSCVETRINTRILLCFGQFSWGFCYIAAKLITITNVRNTAHVKFVKMFHKNTQYSAHTVRIHLQLQFILRSRKQGRTTVDASVPHKEHRMFQ